MKYFEDLTGCLSNIDQYCLYFLGFCNECPLWLDFLDHVDKEMNQTHTRFPGVQTVSKNNFSIAAINN